VIKLPDKAFFCVKSTLSTQYNAFVVNEMENFTYRL